MDAMVSITKKRRNNLKRRRISVTGSCCDLIQTRATEKCGGIRPGVCVDVTKQIFRPIKIALNLPMTHFSYTPELRSAVVY